MPSRLALGSSTNASARLDALLRVMVRLACIGKTDIGDSIFRAWWRQPAGFSQSRIARAFVWMAGFSVPSAAMLARRRRGFATRLSVAVAAVRTMTAPTFAPKSGPNEQD